MNCLLVGAIITLSLSAGPVLNEELIFSPEKVHNHSSTIVESPEGALLAAWFHGSGEKGDDTLVVLGARKAPGASKWSRPFLMADKPGLPDQNPVLFIDPSGTLFLWWVSSLANTRETYILNYRTATDYEGEGAPVWTWNDSIFQEPKQLRQSMEKMAAGVDAKFGAAFDSEDKYRSRLEHGLRMARFDDTYLEGRKEPTIGRLSTMLSWMPRCAPIMLSDTRMAIGLYSDVYLTSLTCYTDDGGATWHYGAPMADYGLIQPALLQRKDGTVVAYGRDKSPNKRIRVAESGDGGMNWTKFYDLAIPNPDSSVALLALKNGHWLLVCNDLTGIDGRHGRSRLAVYLSEDEGHTWPWKRYLEDSTAPDGNHPHASYPSAIQTRDGQIHVTYTYTPSPDETIKHVAFDEGWVREGESLDLARGHEESRTDGLQQGNCIKNVR